MSGEQRKTAEGDDGELLTAYARRGDVESLSALVRRHTVWMMALLRAMLPTAADAEDVFQEAWIRVMRSASRYRGGSVRAYLAVIARSAAIDRLRRSGREVSLDSELGEAVGDTVAAEGPSPRERVERAASSEDVRRAVRELPEGPRQVLLMRIEGELPFKDIAAELGVPLGTALTWMHTATVRLKKILGEMK